MKDTGESCLRINEQKRYSPRESRTFTPALHHWNRECDNGAPSLVARMSCNIEGISIAKAGDGLSGHV